MNGSDEKKVVDAIKMGARTTKEIRERTRYRIPSKRISKICQCSDEIVKTGRRGKKYGYHTEAVWGLDISGDEPQGRGARD